ncbi:MAG: STAS domain-containing protein [Spirochaetes bacterium]|nr:STAS domain-containing protein [Spirochaetota bacterium]
MSAPKKFRIIPHEAGSDSNRADAIFTAPMDPAEWKEFRDILLSMIKKGFIYWRFNLQGIEYPTSTDLGMWVTCNATVSSQSGSIEFLISENSNLRKVLSLTKLDTIFTIVPL